ncbi:MAG: hypothetical protein Q4F57_09640 [Weeksellaceae bacterium]|nr:hypothetical protein [Weeksellaceae bacterium]
MPTILRIILFLIIAWFIYRMVRNMLFPKPTQEKRRNTIGNIKIFKKGEVEQPKYNVKAETVEFEEIKNNESQE